MDWVEKKNINAVVFDFDDTLVSGSYWIEERWRKTLEYVSEEYNINNFEKLFWSIFHQKGPYYKYHVNETLSKISADINLVEDIVKYFHDVQIDDLFIEGALECLEHLKDSYVLGIITNGRKEIQMGRINRIGISDYFSSIICAYDFPKPSKIPFDKCIEELQILPKNIIYVGDNYELDYLPALELGFNPILFNNDLNNIKSKCFHIENFKSLIELLR